MSTDVGAMTRSTACALAFAVVAACGRRAPDPVALGPAADAAPGLLPIADGSPAPPDGEASTALPIPPRAHAPEAPPAGWCGETAIQEGLLSLGVWAPQRLINKAGRPQHPDLYSSDIPVALRELGVRYSVYGGGKGFEAFARWVGKAVDEGDPVLAGVKILPSEHPEWGLDHFVLVVGHGERGLFVNTTWGSRVWVGDTTTPGLSFRNAFYGIRLLGLVQPAASHPARLTVLEEDASAVRVRITCADLRAPYREGERVEPELRLDANRAARFHCVGP